MFLFWKIVALVGMNQSPIAHPRKDVGGEIERQRGGRSKPFVDQKKKHCVTLVTEGRLGTAFATTKQLQSKTCKLLSDIIVRHAFREVGLGAQMQQMKLNPSCKHILARLRFAQRYENRIIDDWKCMIFRDETHINKFNLDGRSWC